MLALELCLGFLLFMGFCASGLMLVRVQERETRVRRRMTAVVGGRMAARPASGAPQVSLLATGRDDRGAVGQLTAILGFDLNLQDQYPVRWWLALLLCLAVAYGMAMLGARLVGDMALAFLPAAWVLLCRMFFNWCDTNRRDKLFRQFPDALAMIVRSVRVGIPVSEALRVVGREIQEPTCVEFGRLADEISIGLPLDRALFQMAERNGLAEYRFFATALSLQNQTGGALSETLENLADVIRKRVAVRERGKALAAEAKTSAGVLTALPPVAGLGLYFLNPPYIAVLFTDPTGKKVLGLAVAMLFTGVMIMRTIIRKSLQ